MDHVLLILTSYNLSLSWNCLASSWEQRHTRNTESGLGKHHLVSLRKSVCVAQAVIQELNLRKESTPKQVIYQQRLSKKGQYIESYRSYPGTRVFSSRGGLATCQQSAEIHVVHQI